MPPIKQYLRTVTGQLVLVNVVVFLLVQALFPRYYTGFELFSWHTPNFEPWQFLSAIFMHGGVSHILFNMIGLWMFGSVLERVWGKQRFLIFYLLCGIGAGIIQQLVRTFLLNDTSPFVGVGASGAVYGLLVAFALLFPNFKLVLIFLPVPIAAKYFVPILLLIDIVGGFTGHSIFAQNIGHFAHIGGALMGFVLLQFWLIPGSQAKPK